MRRTKGIVDEDIAVRCKPRREGRVVLLFAGMKANVLQKEQLTGSKSIHRIICTHAQRITSGRDHHLQVIRKTLCRWSQPESIDHLPVWSTEVRSEHNGRAIFKECLDGWDRGADTRIIHNLPV
jgi:hypothetical protein